MMKKLAIFFAGLAICGTAAAQGFNPVVEVTNAYKGKLMEVHKQEVQMAVPDTMLRFDYDFDYTTFENPYKGAYDFSPYKMNMAPEPRAVDGRSLFVKAGAGYSLNPEARIVWAPRFKEKAADKLSLTFEDDFDGYWGQYHQLSSVNADSWRVLKKVGVFNDGHDAANQLRMTAAVNARKAAVTLSADWNLVNSAYSGASHVSQCLVNTIPVFGNGWNSFGGSLGVQSKGHGRTFADFSLGYRFGSGSSSYFSKLEGSNYEHYVQARSRIGRRLSRPGMMAFVDIDVENESFHMMHKSWSSDSHGQGIFRNNLFLLSVTPTISGHKDRFNYSAGLKVSMTSRGSYPDSVSMNIGNGHIFYPQIHVDYALVKDALKIYADFGGGDRVDTYNSLVSRYHFLNLTPQTAMEHVVDVYDFKAGLSGRAHARFQYEVEGGLNRTDNAVCESFNQSLLNILNKSYDRGNVFSAYAKASGAWTSESFDVRARFMFRHSEALDEFAMLLPSRFTGGFSATWNWRQRIYLGATMDAASYRRSVNFTETWLDLSSSMTPLDYAVNLKVPGYIDLGVNAEYRASTRVSLWAKGGNLLGNAIQREAMFARRGAFFTLGLSVNL